MICIVSFVPPSSDVTSAFTWNNIDDQQSTKKIVREQDSISTQSFIPFRQRNVSKKVVTVFLKADISLYRSSMQISMKKLFNLDLGSIALLIQHVEVMLIN